MATAAETEPGWLAEVSSAADVLMQEAITASGGDPAVAVLALAVATGRAAGLAGIDAALIAAVVIGQHDVGAAIAGPRETLQVLPGDAKGKN